MRRRTPHLTLVSDLDRGGLPPLSEPLSFDEYLETLKKVQALSPFEPTHKLASRLTKQWMKLERERLKLHRTVPLHPVAKFLMVLWATVILAFGGGAVIGMIRAAATCGE